MLYWKGNRVDVEPLHDRIPSGRIPEKAPRWDLPGIEGYGGGKVFWWTLLAFGNIWEFVGQELGLEELGGANKP